MNEFTVKKLAEVQAFIDTGNSIIGMGGHQFAATAPEVTSLLLHAKKTVIRPAIPSDWQDTFETKTKKTSQKLRGMMELYVGDEWDNPVEVLEWTSFFAGAGAAHAGLTAVAMEATDPGLTENLVDLVQTYKNILDEVIRCLQTVARSKR